MFDRGSHISFLGESAFRICSLQSISVPSSIESISASCFSGCKNLSNVTFAPDCRLSILGDWAFEGCSSLQSLHIPRTVRQVTGLTMASSGIRSVTVDPGNEFFNVWDDFLVDFGETCLIRYLGDESEIVIGGDIEMISSG
jgi:hypothetical protein